MVLRGDAEMLAAAQQLRALTLEERIDLFGRLPASDFGDNAPERDDHFDLFRSGEAISPKTFQSYGIADPARLRLARTSAKSLLEAGPPSQWLTDFEAQYHNPSSCGTPQFARSELGACDCFWPLINAAVSDVRAFLARSRANAAALQIDEEQVLDAAMAALYGKLFAACGRAIVVELGAAHAKGLLHGETPEERFSFFVECLRDASFSRKILGQYPVLIRLAVALTGDWRDAFIEFLTRLLSDRDEISNIFFEGRPLEPLSLVELSAGDSHNRGRSVIIAQLEDGCKIVYKPKSLAVDHHFVQLVDWVNARAQDFSLATAMVIDKTAYGWSEFIAPRPCAKRSEVRNFYRRQGANLALLYLLGGCDLHSENLIATGDTPKLIDLETLFHPILLPEDISGATKQVHLHLCRSVLRTGLLPYRLKDLPAPEDWVDLSGLGNAEERELPFEIVAWEDTATDQMRLAYRRPVTTANQNLPVYRGERVGADAYVDDIIDGFGRAYRLFCAHREELLAHDGPIHAFKGDKIRVVVRATNRYVLLLDEAFHPDYLADALAKEAFFDSLWEEAHDHKLLGRLIPAERRDLWRGDVPYFWTRTDAADVWTSTGARIPDVVDVAGFEVALECISQLSDEDLEHQTNLIRSAFAVVTQQTPAARTLRVRLGSRRDASASHRQIATRIGDRLEETAIRDGDRASWVVLSQTVSTHVAAGPAGIDLYDGLPGIALFLGYLGGVTQETRFQELARASVREMLATPSLREPGHPSGAFAGRGGVIYAMAHLGKLMPEEDYVDLAEDLAEIVHKDLENEAELDVIAGLAGIILSALAAAQLTGRSVFAGLAAKSGEVLADRLSRPRNQQHRDILEGRRWPLSFAHGRAGIAYSLIKLYETYGQRQFNVAALELVERDLADIDHVGPSSGERAPDHAGAVASQLAWCHGKLGVALALRAARGQREAQKIDETVTAVLSAITSAPLERSDCICHGNLGNLLLAGELMGDEAAAARLYSAREKRVLRRISGDGLVCGNFGLETAGLMDGLAGMGMALLKLAEPARFPNVLILESTRAPE